MKSGLFYDDASVDEQEIDAGTQASGTVTEETGLDPCCSSYEVEDEYDSPQTEEYEINTTENKSSCIGLFIKTMTHPVEGWKEIRRSHYSVEQWGSGCFYPLSALCAVSAFAERLYNPNAALEEMLKSGVSNFVAYFFGYFIITLIVGSAFGGKGGEGLSSRFGRVFVMVSLSSMALFTSACNFLPMLEPVLVFLPLWTTYIIYKGCKFLRIEDRNKALTMILMSFLIIGMPVGLMWVFSYILS